MIERCEAKFICDGPIGVQNLFCDGPIGVQNLFCDGPIGVQNLFCEGPIGVQNLFCDGPILLNAITKKPVLFFRLIRLLNKIHKIARCLFQNRRWRNLIDVPILKCRH